MDCSDWTDEQRKNYEKDNELFGFYESNTLTMGHKRVTEFPVVEDKKPVHEKRKKIGRNAQCPCGSGKKFKKCCLNKLQ